MKTTAKDKIIMTFGYFTLWFLMLLAPLFDSLANFCIFLKKRLSED